jgi:AAA domain
MTAKVTDTLGNQMKPKEQVSPGVVREIRPGVIQAKHVLPYSWDGEEQLVFPVYLVEDIITESTIGLMVAESTGGKTFTATDMAYAIGLGLPFFGKDTERGGVIYVAAEAPGTIPIRQKAAREHRALPLVSMLGHHVEDGLTMEQASRLPVVTITDVPNLSTPAGVNDLIATIQEIAVGMEERHGLPIKLIIIDTVLAAFCVEDWNSAGQTTAVHRYDEEDQQGDQRRGDGTGAPRQGYLPRPRRQLRAQGKCRFLDYLDRQACRQRRSAAGGEPALDSDQIARRARGLAM